VNLVINPSFLTCSYYVFAEFFDELGVIAVNSSTGWFVRVDCALAKKGL